MPTGCRLKNVLLTSSADSAQASPLTLSSALSKLVFGRIGVRGGLTLAAALAAFSLTVTGARAEDFSTLYGKHIAGYQGWFGCPADGVGWFHWFRDNKPSADNLVVDMMPDVSWLKPAERCDTTLKSDTGDKVYLFSSKDPAVVREHFKWMREYNVDGVALQRFVSALSGGQGLFTDAVLHNVRESAEAEGRGFFLMYDVSGDDPLVVQKVIDDWTKLTASGLTKSPSYFHHSGKPVVGLWGAGINDRAITPDQIGALIKYFHDPQHAATIVGGVPMYWRTLGRDSKKDPAWARIYRSYDVISPWSVGRLHNPGELAEYLRTGLTEDIHEAKKVGKDYLPVLYPGMSFHNAQRGKVALNDIPRDCGLFYQQYGDGLINSGARMLYTAMFDEVNEGTAIFKVDVSRSEAPVGAPTATLSDQGCEASSDFYLSLAGKITNRLQENSSVRPRQ